MAFMIVMYTSETSVWKQEYKDAMSPGYLSPNQYFLLVQSTYAINVKSTIF